MFVYTKIANISFWMYILSSYKQSIDIFVWKNGTPVYIILFDHRHLIRCLKME